MSSLEAWLEGLDALLEVLMLGWRLDMRARDLIFGPVGQACGSEAWFKELESLSEDIAGIIQRPRRMFLKPGSWWTHKPASSVAQDDRWSWGGVDVDSGHLEYNILDRVRRRLARAVSRPKSEIKSKR